MHRMAQARALRGCPRPLAATPAAPSRTSRPGPALASASLLLLLLCAAPWLPSAAAQPSVPAIDVLQDPAGDVAVSFMGQAVTNPTPRLPQVDLVAASVQEEESLFSFRLTLASLEPPAEPPLLESAFYAIHFQHADVQYAIQVGRVRSVESGTFGWLARYDPAEDRYYIVDFLPTTEDTAAATITVHVPRDLVVDGQGAKPYPGRLLEGFWAESQAFAEIFLFPVGFTGQGPPRIRDRMPDAGNGTKVVPVVFGPEQVGSARLSSPLPTRNSNGEATTFLFTVEARNVGDGPAEYALEARNVPQGWTVLIPEEVVALEGGGSLSVPVLVTVPFTHEHGTFRSFLLAMQAIGDPGSRAQLELGVRYPRVPQPAGHHDTLLLHSARFSEDPTVPVYATAFGFNVEYGWMNALEEDPGDQELPLPTDPRFSFVPEVPGTFRWSVPLSPDLAIGLDFDLEREGAFTGAVTTTMPLLQATLSGELAHYVDSRFDEFGTRVGGNRTVLATLAASAPQDIAPGDTAPFALTVTPLPASDLVPFRRGSALVLELNLTGMRPDTFFARDPPKLLPGALLQLPLNEYRDPVDAGFAATAKLRLQADTPPDRVANAGKTVVHRVTVQAAEDAAPHTVRLRLSGTNTQWARILGPAERPVQPGAGWQTAVAVQVPQGTPTGATADLVLHAETGDPSMKALLRLHATVSATQEVADEAALAAELSAGETQDTPAPWAIAWLAAALAAAGWRRRRGKPL